jgi:hypothetical protein
MRLHRHHIADPNAAAGDATDNEVADDELADVPAGEASP